MLKNKRFLVLGFDLLLIILLFAAKSITHFLINDSFVCFFRKFGILCPACGSTRAVYNFVLGNFTASFTSNPFIFLLIIYLAAITVILNLEFVFKLKFAEKIRKRAFNCKILIAMVICYAVFGVFRNFL